MSRTGTLGTSYRCLYIAKNYVSDLTNITVKIIKPDFMILDAQPLVEFTDPNLRGCYHYDYETTKDSDLGDYIFVINNPEQGLKAGFRVTYQSKSQSVALDTISEGLRKNYFG